MSTRCLFLVGPPFSLAHCLSAMRLAFLLPGCLAALAEQAPIFTQEPAPQNVFVGVNVLLSAQATSTLPVSYQWRVNDAAMAGKTNATLDLFCVSLVQSGQVFSVVASNTAGAVTSSPALLQVQVPYSGPTPRTWGNNPAAHNNNFVAKDHRGEIGATFCVDVYNTNVGGLYGTGVYTHDSSIAAAAVHTGLLPVGQRGTVVLQILAGQAEYFGSTRYGVRSFDWGGYGGSFQLLGLAPTITRHPKHQVRMVGGTVTFRVEAFGNGPLRYQWKHNGDELPDETGGALGSGLALWTFGAIRCGVKSCDLDI